MAVLKSSMIPAEKMCRIGRVGWSSRDLLALGPQLSHIIAIARITLEETEDGWVATEKTCSTRIERPEFPDLITEIPDAF